MNSERILKELSTFPKVYTQSEEQKRNNLRQIMSKYDAMEKKRWSFSPQRLMVGSASVFAVLLACFLILSNTGILERFQGDETPSHQKKEQYISKAEAVKVASDLYPAAEWEEPKFVTQLKEEVKDRPTWIVTGALPSGQQAIVYVDAVTGKAFKNEEVGTSFENGFYPDELEKVTSINISDSSGMGIANFSEKNKDKVAAFTKLLKDAQFYGVGKPELGDSYTGEHFSVTLDVSNGTSLTVDIWPNEKGPNMREANSNTWWTVKNTGDFFEFNIGERTVEYEDALQIAQDLYPDIEWVENETSPELTKDESFNMVGGVIWKVLGLASDDKILIIYIDPTNGKVLDEKTFTTEDGVAVVKNFFEKVKSGDLEAAYEMIHPYAKTPSTKISEESFNEFFSQNKLELTQIESAKWESEYLKFPTCMCSISQKIKVKAKFSDGTIMEFHVVRTKEEEEWKLFWNYEQKKLE